MNQKMFFKIIGFAIIAYFNMFGTNLRAQIAAASLDTMSYHMGFADHYQNLINPVVISPSANGWRKYSSMGLNYSSDTGTVEYSSVSNGDSSLSEGEAENTVIDFRSNLFYYKDYYLDFNYQSKENKFDVMKTASGSYKTTRSQSNINFNLGVLLWETFSIGAGYAVNTVSYKTEGYQEIEITPTDEQVSLGMNLRLGLFFLGIGYDNHSVRGSGELGSDKLKIKSQLYNATYFGFGTSMGRPGKDEVHFEINAVQSNAFAGVLASDPEQNINDYKFKEGSTQTINFILEVVTGNILLGLKVSNSVQENNFKDEILGDEISNTEYGIVFGRAPRSGFNFKLGVRAAEGSRTVKDNTLLNNISYTEKITYANNYDVSLGWNF